MITTYMVRNLKFDKFLDTSKGSHKWVGFFDANIYYDGKDALEDADEFGGEAVEVSISFKPIHGLKNKRDNKKFKENRVTYQVSSDILSREIVDYLQHEGFEAKELTSSDTPTGNEPLQLGDVALLPNTPGALISDKETGDEFLKVYFINGAYFAVESGSELDYFTGKTLENFKFDFKTILNDYTLANNKSTEIEIKETLYGHNSEYDDPSEKYYNQHDDTHEKPSHTKNKDLAIALDHVFHGDLDIDSGIDSLARDIFDENDAGYYDWHDVDDLADAVFEAGYEDEANALWDAIADDRQLTENKKLKERIADKALPYYHEFCRRLFYKLPDFIDSICESYYVTIEPEDSSSGCINITISTDEDPRDAVYVYVSKSDVFIEYPKTNFERQVVYTPEASFQEIEDEVAEIVNEALNELEKKNKI